MSRTACTFHKIREMQHIQDVLLSLSQQQLCGCLPTLNCDIQIALQYNKKKKNWLSPNNSVLLVPVSFARHFHFFQRVCQLDCKSLAALQQVHLFWQTSMNIKLVKIRRACINAARCLCINSAALIRLNLKVELQRLICKAQILSVYAVSECLQMLP